MGNQRAILGDLAKEVVKCGNILSRVAFLANDAREKVLEYQKVLGQLDRVLRKGKELEREEELGLTDLNIRHIKDLFHIEDEIRAERELLRRKKGKSMVAKFEPEHTLEKAGIKALSNEEIAEKLRVNVREVNVLREIEVWKTELKALISKGMEVLKEFIALFKEAVKDCEADREIIVLAEKEDVAVVKGLRGANEMRPVLKVHSLLKDAYGEVNKIIAFGRRVIETAESEKDNLREFFSLAVAGVDIFEEAEAYEKRIAAENAPSVEELKEKRGLGKAKELSELAHEREVLNAAVHNFGYLMNLEKEMIREFFEELREVKRGKAIGAALSSARMELEKLGVRVS